jgi:hypothetical protein
MESIVVFLRDVDLRISRDAASGVYELEVHRRLVRTGLSARFAHLIRVTAGAKRPM